MTHEVQSASTFIFGGNAEFTIRNTSSGNGYKYRVRKGKPKGDRDVYFVKVKNGATWEYAGCVLGNASSFYYVRGQKGALEFDAPAIRGLLYAIRKGANPLPKPMSMIHHGRCAHCGRRLDDETSIERGFGPVCWKTMS